MITDIFLKLLNMSISASYLVLALLLLRLLLPKMPKWVNCLLWGIVAIRLLLPFSLESAWSLVPSAQVIPQDIAQSQTPAIYSGITAVNNTVNPMLTLKLLRGELMLDRLLHTVCQIWLVGVAVMLLYSGVSYLLLRWRIRTSITVQKGIRVCDDVDSPFVLGILFPKIYLPSGMDEGSKDYVLAHEQAHIKRLDHMWKPLGFLLLTFYWFNPLLWLAYILLCRDIERACDEKVIAQLNPSGKKGYSQALLACSVHRRMIMACPVAFGEIGVKSRIKAVLHYKKASFWILLLSIAVSAVTVVCFASDPIPCNHSYHSRIALSSTCTQHGLQINTCDQCQHSYGQPAQLVSHTYDSGTVTLMPTCTRPGILTLYCTGCEATKPQSIEQIAHVLGDSYTVTEPDCIHQGIKVAVCSQCQQRFITDILPVNDVHDLVDSVVRSASCTAPGEGIRECSRCDYSESCSYPALWHNYEEKLIERGTCIKRDVYEVTCTRCGKSYTKYGFIGWHHMVEYSTYNRCEYCGYRINKIPEQKPLFGRIDPSKEIIEIFPNPSPMPELPKLPGWP